MLQILNLLSILQNQVFGLWGQKSGILNATWATCWSPWSSSLPQFWMFTKGVWPRSRLQSRAGKSVCKGGEYPLPLYVRCFIFENVHVGANNVL